MATRVSELRNGKASAGSFTDLDDRMLVLDFQAGNSDEAYAEIHRRYVALARHICMRILGNPHDAEEATQETMLRVFQGLSRFNGRYAVQPWVARIATNVALDITRARARRPQAADRTLDTLEHHADEGPEGDPGQTVERAIEGERVNEVLADLPERHREALVLREYEGRSHKEIGNALGVTPTQAKALIHRAKGSFRRVWDGRDGDRGIAGLFVFLFLLPYRALGVLRRLADRAGDAGQAAASSSPSVTAAAASPAVQVAAAETGQKVVAAAVTLLVAGSVTVGAATLVRHKPQHPASATSPAVVPAPSPPAGIVLPTRSPKPDKGSRELLGRSGHSAGPRPAASGSPTPDASGTPTPDASGTPTPDPSGPPSATPPAIPLPPDWSGSFRVDWASDDYCGCGPGIKITSQAVTGQLTADTDLTVRQSIEGAALDAEGDAAWAVTAEYQATLGARAGSLDLGFTLGRDGSSYRFETSMGMATPHGTPGDGQPVVYTFSGTYTLEQGVADTSPVPVTGVVSATVLVWADGTTVYGVGFGAGR